MGVFAQGFGDPQQAAKASLLSGALGTGVSALGQYASGVGQSQMYNYQAQVASNNAAIARQNAQQAVVSGTYEESIAKTKGGILGAEQKVAQAANGVDVNIGSPVSVRQASANVSAMDAAMIHLNAARTSGALEFEARNFDTQSEVYRSAAKNSKTEGTSKAFTTLLGGATALSQKYSTFKKSGAL